MLESGGRIAGGALLLLVFIFVGSSHELARAAALDVHIGHTVIRKEVKSVLDLRFRNMVRQNTDYSCGAAALATILTYHFGSEVSEAQILDRILSDADEKTLQRVVTTGVSLLDLKNYAESLGYVSRGYRFEKDDLRKMDGPGIGLVNIGGYNHFVVIKGVVDDRVYIADPAKGNLTKRIGEFMKMWNRIILVFEKSDSVQSRKLAVGSELTGRELDLIPNLVDMGFGIDPWGF